MIREVITNFSIMMAKLYHHRTPDQMTVDYGVTLAQVYAALAY